MLPRKLAPMLFSLLLSCGLVHAADPVEPGPDVDAGLNPGSKKPLWELGLGVAGLRLPDYRGSDHYRD